MGPATRLLMIGSVFTTGCLFNDRCESLCGDISFRLEECMTAAMSWEDLGARSRSEWASACRRDWEASTSELSSRDLELALNVCQLTSEELMDWSCEEVLALYAP